MYGWVLNETQHVEGPIDNVLFCIKPLWTPCRRLVLSQRWLTKFDIADEDSLLKSFDSACYELEHR